MRNTIETVFQKLFPARANESLSAADKLIAILDHCDTEHIQLVGEDAMIKALIAGLDIQFDADEHKLVCRIKDHVEEICGVSIDWDSTTAIRSLLQKEMVPA